MDGEVRIYGVVCVGKKRGAGGVVGEGALRVRLGRMRKGCGDGLLELLYL